MVIEQAQTIDRELLAFPRAEIWRGLLTAGQFRERNYRLYSHPFGRERVTTWVARDSNGTIVSSLDSLRLDAFTGAQKKSPCHLIASVLTPPAHRGNNLARTLISGVLARNPSDSTILFSDIPPTFYEPLGFIDMPVIEIIQPLGETNPKHRAEAVTAGEFIRKSNQNKANSMENLHFTTVYDEVFLDWQIERFRYFAQLRGKRLPENLYWLGSHEHKTHPILAVPNYLDGVMEGLTLTPQCQQCVRLLAFTAQQASLKSIRYWQADRLRGTRHPMVRLPEAGGTQWVDQQALDYW